MPYTIEKLRKLNEAATSGPWKFNDWTAEEGCHAVRTTGGVFICTPDTEDDGRSIAYLRTHLPEIIADLEELESRREKEKAALKE